MFHKELTVCLLEVILGAAKSVRIFAQSYSIIPMVFLLSVLPVACSSLPRERPHVPAREAVEEQEDPEVADLPEAAEPDSRDPVPDGPSVPAESADHDQPRPPDPHREEPSGPLAVARLDDPVPFSLPSALPERVPPLREEEIIDRIVAGMSLEDRVGQLFMPAIIADSRGVPRLVVDDEVRRLIDTIRPGGVILFGPNLHDPEQTRRLVRDLQEASPFPLLIAVDQEGGVVSRLTSSAMMPATIAPSARRIGLAGDEELAYQVARATGRELRTLGITMNFAPVADVLTNPGNPVIGSRAFGSDPELVSRMVAATVRGLQDSGVSAVVKHFPGHGDTSLDTHLQTVVVPHALDRLREVEFIPFTSGFAAGADGVMTAHISLPGVTGDHTPSTLSPLVLRELLRGEFGYEGLIITDSLIMGALTAENVLPGITEDHLPLRAFQAGADILLYPPRPEVGYRTLLEAFRRGDLSERDLDEAVRRILRVKFSRGLMRVPPTPLSEDLYLRPEHFFPEELELGLPEHRAVMEEVLRRSR
ncbi:MAG: glycoside hydrolase family 3 [Spirochaetaceae bacterium]|nr:MAG: glycoside hydrolase family 3 [Spirochaetaceae bacterium]